MTPRALADEWIPVGAAARRLKRCARQVHYYIERGLLRSRRVGPRGWKQVAAKDVAKLVASADRAN